MVEGKAGKKQGKRPNEPTFTSRCWLEGNVVWECSIKGKLKLSEEALADVLKSMIHDPSITLKEVSGAHHPSK